MTPSATASSILSDRSTPAKPKLLDQVRWHLRVKHYSIRTEESYVDWIRRFIWHAGCKFVAFSVTPQFLHRSGCG